MRILVLTFYYQPDLCAGSFRTTSLAKALKKRLQENDTLDIITTMPNRYSSFCDNALEFEEDHNIKIYRINLGSHKSGFIDQSLLFVKFAFKAANIIRKNEKYDLVYATSSRLMTAFLGALIANKQRSKLFLDLRDIFTDTLESLFTKKRLKYVIPLFKQIEKYTVNSAHHINLVSQGFQTYFEKINTKITYSFYSNGIDDEFLNFDFTKEKQTAQKIITYAGNIGEGQGLDKIIPQMAKVLGDDYMIYVIGDGGTKQKLVDSLQDITNVEVLLPVNRLKLLDIYKKSDYLFLHLNDYEAFQKVLPSKIFEYAATYKTIIAGVGGYARNFIEMNLSGSIVFDPCNVHDFMQNFQAQQKHISVDRKEFIQRYSREHIMDELSRKVYEL